MRPVERGRLAALGVVAVTLTGCSWSPPLLAGVAEGPLDADEWSRFVADFVQDDGRVIDRDSEARISTSEGQAYGLFFALVAGDRLRFAQLLDWTRANLAGGRFDDRLPAWQWGRLPDGRWGVMDGNAASDADLWLAYVLSEAGRLWQVPAYLEQARQVLRLVVRDEVAEVPGLGPMLLPGPAGFVSPDRRTWRFNPSYSPPHLLRALARFDPAGPWATLARQAVLMLQACSPHGLAPDWVAWQLAEAGRPAGRWVPDPVHGELGSYDAIRCYLWAGVLSPQDPLQPALLHSLRGLLPLARLNTALPERLATRSDGLATGHAPTGFDAAVLPLLAARGETAALAVRLDRLQAARRQGGRLRYYDHALLLFGAEWLRGRWRCDRDGRLQPLSHSLFTGLPQDLSCRSSISV